MKLKCQSLELERQLEPAQFRYNTVMYPDFEQFYRLKSMAFLSA